MKGVAILLTLVVFFVSCGKNELETQQVSNVRSTPCRQDVLKSGELSSNIKVEFTAEGVHITYNNFEVTCDFSDVKVTHTFVNGVLNIIQEGLPNQANCVCHSNVSYTIEGVSQDKVNVIFINGVQVYCYNDKPQEPCHCVMDTLKGEWSWFKTSIGTPYNDAGDNQFKSVIRILSQNEDETINYKVFVADTLFSTGNFQIQEAPGYIVGSRRSSIKLPHIGVSPLGWLFVFLEKEEFFFYTGAIGPIPQPFYHYKKIGEE